MQVLEFTAIPLPRCVLCVNCMTVTDSIRDRCPVCDSPSLGNLAVMLDGRREQSKEASHV